MGQGHSGEVFASRFDPAGQMIASGSMDRSISTKPASSAPAPGGKLTRI